MVYNSYFANIVSRLVFLLASFTGLAFLLVHTSRFFTILLLVTLAIIQVISLISFLNKTNRNLARFLLLLTEEDTSVIAWKDRVEHTFQGLHHSFKEVNEEINRIKLEKEKGSILLQNTLDHIHTGIFVIDNDGVIQLVNAEALRIFGVLRIEHLNELDRLQEGLSAVLLNLRHDSGNIIHLKLEGDDQLPVLVRVSAFKLGGMELRLYSIQGIKNELEANEIESWQKLTRVLAHEISNSVTPISTLGAGIARKLAQASRNKSGEMQLQAGLAGDLLQSAELIERRSNALVDFMEHYKTFTRLPAPVPEKVDALGFFESLRLFFNRDLAKLRIEFKIILEDTNLHVWADRGLLEQAFINLVRNSMEALENQEKGIITLKASRQSKDVVFEVSDNGPGIPADIQSQVFIPFFTTKSTGTGIGMSIVRKIVIMSGGSIRFDTYPGKETRFTIHLPAS